MEGVSVNVYKGLRGYWTRRNYQRLGGSGRGRKIRTVDAGSGRTRRRRLWRFKISRKLKLKFRLNVSLLRSPKRLLIWLRDRYVRMMMGLANTRVCSTAGFGGAVADPGINSFGSIPLKEYDQRVIVEIYKSLVAAQDKLVSAEALNRLPPLTVISEE